MLKEHPTLKSLCGNRGDETELDMSGKMGGAGDAVMLAAEVIDNGALSSLNLAENLLCGLDEFGRGVFDASGNTSPLFMRIPLLTLDHPHLCQVLSPLPMPSPIWGHYRR
jgi:hypothetical protein